MSALTANRSYCLHSKAGQGINQTTPSIGLYGSVHNNLHTHRWSRGHDSKHTLSRRAALERQIIGIYYNHEQIASAQSLCTELKILFDNKSILQMKSVNLSYLTSKKTNHMWFFYFYSWTIFLKPLRKKKSANIAHGGIRSKINKIKIIKPRFKCPSIHKEISSQTLHSLSTLQSNPSNSLNTINWQHFVSNT